MTVDPSMVETGRDSTVKLSIGVTCPSSGACGFAHVASSIDALLLGFRLLGFFVFERTEFRE